MRFLGACRIALLILLLRSPVGLGVTGADTAKPCPELLPLLREQLEVAPSQSRLHPNARQKPLTGPRQAALDTLKFIKDSEFTKIPDYKLNKALYQRVMKFRSDPEFLATLKENPEIWARVEPLMRRLTASSAQRAAWDTLEYIRSSRFRWLPTSKADPALYQQFLKYQDDPEFQAILRENPEEWARIEPLFERKEASPATKAALDTLAFIKGSGFTKTPDAEWDKALSQRLWRYIHTSEFQDVIKEHPKAWALIEPLLKKKDLSGAVPTALETFEFIKSTGFDRLPNQKESAALYQRFLRYRGLPEFKAALRENPENWALIEHLFKEEINSPARQAALDTIEAIKSTGFTRLPHHKLDEALYQRFMKYRADPEFQAVLKESPESWKLFEKKYPQFK